MSDGVDHRSVGASATVASPNKVKPDGNAASEDEDWSNYLTPVLRKKFKKMGRYLVEQQVLSHQFELREKRLAALEWLTRKRMLDRWISAATTAIPAILAALLGALLGAHLNQQAAEQRQLNEEMVARHILEQVLTADITALLTQEQARHDALASSLKTLVDVPFPSGNPQDQRLPRPWLMAPAILQFPVFEQNAGRLGSLAPPLPEKVAYFYGYSYALRSHVNVVTSPPIIFASGGDKQYAVAEYESAYRIWVTQANEVLKLLREGAN